MFQPVNKDVFGIAGAVLAMKEPLGIFVCDGHYPIPDLLRSDNIEDVEAGSGEEEDILRHLSESFLDKKFESAWKVAKVQKITNEKVAQEFEDKRQDFLVKGRKGAELEECYGFFVENNVAEVELVASTGLQVRESEYNALGYNRQGVYVCRHADVCLQHSLVKHSGSQVMKMVMCRYIPGRPTTAIPRVASAAEFIEPTQGFDCHESVISPDSRDSLQNKFDRSQVYLYEINKLLQPSPRPRQVQPCAVFNFTQNGAYTPLIDAEPTPEQRLAASARLQQVLAQMDKNALDIRNKFVIDADATREQRLAASACLDWVLSQIDKNAPEATVATAPVAAAPAPNLGPGLIAVPPTATIPATVTLTDTTSPALTSPTTVTPAGAATNALQNGAAGSEQGSSPAPNVEGLQSPGPPVEEAGLTKVVTQLNAKLGPHQYHHAVRRHIPSRSSPAVAAMSAPPAPPSALTGMSYHPSYQQILMNAASLSPQLHAAGIPGHPGHIMMAGQPGLIPGQPGLIHGQPGLIPGHPGLMPGHPGLMQAPHGLIHGQPGLIPGQQAIIQGQPGMVPGQAGLMPGLMAGNPHMMLGAPNGLPRQALQMVQMPGLPASMAGMLRPTFPGLMSQARHGAPEPTHVPAAGYVANNVSGYTPANSAPPAGTQHLGQPIPVLANGMVTVSSAAQQQVLSPTSQSIQAMAGMGAMPGGIAMSVANVQQQMAAAAAAAQAGGMPGYGLGAAVAATPSMSGMMMAPSPAGAPAGAPQLAYAAQPMLAQKLPAVQPGLVPGALPMQNIAMAQTLKRQLPDPYAILDKRLRLA